MKKRFLIVNATGRVAAQTAARRHARVLFLTAVAEQTPEVLRGLEEGPLDVFRSLTDLHDADEPLHWDALASTTNPRHERLRDAVHQWATRWNLDALWVHDAALRAIERWTFGDARYDGGNDGGWGGHRILVTAQTSRRVTFPVTITDWKIQCGESRQGFRRRVRTRLDRLLTKHCNRLQDQFDKMAEPSSRRGHPDRFKWSVRRIVLGHSYDEIALDHPKCSADKLDSIKTTVRRNVEAVASSIGLVLRHQPRGRRRTNWPLTVHRSTPLN